MQAAPTVNEESVNYADPDIEILKIKAAEKRSKQPTIGEHFARASPFLPVLARTNPSLKRK